MLRLEMLRKELGLSQEDFAKKVNMTQQRISAYEKGKREPDIETIKQFADFFKISIDYLLGKSDIRTPAEQLPKDFQFAFYNKNAEGLSDDEISDALLMYKEMKKRIDKNKK